MMLNSLQIQYPDFFDAVAGLQPSHHIVITPVGKEFCAYRVNRGQFGVTQILTVTRCDYDEDCQVFKITDKLADELEHYLHALGITKMTYKLVKGSDFQ